MKYSSFPWIIAIKVYSLIGDLAPAGVTAEKRRPVKLKLIFLNSCYSLFELCCFLLSRGVLINFMMCMIREWYCGAGYLDVFCRILLDELDRLPGDSRMQIGFIAFDSLLYFYGLDPSFPQPKMFIISDLDGKYSTLLLCDLSAFFLILETQAWSVMAYH